MESNFQPLNAQYVHPMGYIPQQPAVQGPVYAVQQVPAFGHRRGRMGQGRDHWKNRRRFFRGVLAVLVLATLWIAYTTFVSMSELKESVKELQDLIRESSTQKSSGNSNYQNSQKLEQESFSDFLDDEESILRDDPPPANYTFDLSMTTTTPSISVMVQLQDTRLAVGESKNSQIKIYNTQTGKLNQTINTANGKKFDFKALLQLQDGRLVSATTEFPYAIKVWDLNDLSLEQVIYTTNGYITGLLQQEDGQIVAMDWKYKIYVFDPVNFRKPTRTFQAFNAQSTGWAPLISLGDLYPNQFAALVGYRDVVQIWNSNSWTLNSTLNLSQVTGFVGHVTSIDGTVHGNMVAGQNNNYVLCFNPFTGVDLGNLIENSTAPIESIQILEWTTLVSGGPDGLVQVWDLNAGYVTQSFKMNKDKGDVLTLANLQNGEFAAASTSGQISIYGQVSSTA